MIDYTSVVSMMSNNNLQSICKGFGRKTVSKDAINFVASQGIMNQTANYRFAGDVNSNMKSLAINLIPFPRMKFCIPSQAGFRKEGECT
jgi:hypothetical protein